VKVPAEALKSPANLMVSRMGQMLFAPTVSLPLSDEDIASAHKVWFWNGRAAASIDLSVEHKVEEKGSNQAIMESVAVPYLSADGNHLFWFASQMRVLEREGVELSTGTSLLGWQTDLSGNGREEIASSKLPDCRCPTGSCEETCPSFVIWVPEGGVETFFLATQFVAGRTASVYKASTRYALDGGKWAGTSLSEPLQRVLDSDTSGKVFIEAIPDTGCCGWSNQSNDQTLVLAGGKKITVFDEQATYKNPDYDVSFYTANARLSPDSGYVAMTIASTAQANKAFQLAEDGQANPEESQRIRKALADLPSVEVKSIEDTPRRIGLVPHAALVGWISEKEMLIVENHLLVAYSVTSGARRKSTVRVEDAARMFLR
jgi:hypothetical protein